VPVIQQCTHAVDFAGTDHRSTFEPVLRRFLFGSLGRRPLTLGWAD